MKGLKAGNFLAFGYLFSKFKLCCTKEPRSSSPNFLDVAFLGVYRKLREEGGEIRNKYRAGEFISRVHFALRSRRMGGGVYFLQVC